MPTRRPKAFTMIELIVVIVILGILAALAIPTFNKVIETSRIKTMEQSSVAFGRNVSALAAFDGASPRLSTYVNSGAAELPAGYRRLGILSSVPPHNVTVILAQSADGTLDEGELCAVVSLPETAGGQVSAQAKRSVGGGC